MGRVEIDGLLRRHYYGRVTSGATHVRLTECPACHVPFGEKPNEITKHLEAEHGPEDFGLTPMESADE